MSEGARRQRSHEGERVFGAAEKARNFGETLKRERELRKITLREVNEKTKINIRYLEALERNDFRHLPAGAFTKGFIRAYAECIGLDPNETLNSYLYELQNQQEGEETETLDATTTSLKEHFDLEHGRAAKQRRATRIVLLIVAFLVLAGAVSAAALFVMHQTQTTGDLGRPPLIPIESSDS